MVDRDAPSNPIWGGFDRRLWLVNQYAITADDPGITRHAMLADQLRASGWRTTIFASRTHYWNLASKPDSAQVEDRPEATYVRIPTAGSVTNGVRRVASMISFSARIYRVASRRLSEERPDAVLGSSPHLFAAVAALALARRARVPFVLEVRDVWPESLVQLMGLSRRNPLVVAMSVMETFLYRRADLIVSVLPGLTPHVERVAGQLRARVVHIPNGVVFDHERKPAPSTSRTDGPFTIMYAGAHGVPNCLDDLLAAADIVQRTEATVPEGERTRFVLIGDGKEKQSLVEQARRLRLTNVSFEAPTPKSELVDRLKAADAFVLLWRNTPLYRLGVSPNKLFDYFAAAKPVIMGLNGPHDPVREAGAGLSVAAEAPAEVAAAVEQMRSMSESERQAMGAAGLRFLQANHDVRRLARLYASELDRAVEAMVSAPPRHPRWRLGRGRANITVDR